MMDETRVREDIHQAAESYEVAPFPAATIERTARRHRRRTQLGLVAATAVAVAGGLVANGVVGSDPANDISASTSAMADDRTTTSDSVPGPVSATMGVEASMKYTYSTVGELALAPQVTSIVRGTIAEVTYQTVEGMAKTTFDVDVSESLLGTTKQTITVHEDGGYIKASDIMAEIQEKFPDSEQALDPDSYVDVAFEGAPHPEKGEEVVLFLMADPNVGHEGEFMGLMSVYSRFTLDSDGAFRRAATTAGMEKTATLSGLRSILLRR